MSDPQLESIQRSLDALDRGVRDGLVFKALREGAKVLQQQAVNSLRSALGEAATRKSARRKYAMVDGIKITTDKAYGLVKVHIMGDFRNKWFEKGTQPRYTDGTASRGRAKMKRRVSSWEDTRKRKVGTGRSYRGQIHDTGFFSVARSSAEQPMINTINNVLAQQIEKYLK